MSIVLTLVILGPLLTGPGSWLVGDMVFVPRQPWKPAWLGLDGALPRAVPMDALVSALTQVVPGSVLQRVFLGGALVLGGLGIARLVGDLPGLARAAAITVFLWNPWVHDHLQMGQWAILCGYLALPWVALAARRVRRDPRSGWAPVALTLIVSAVCSPSSGLMAVLTVVVLGVRPSRRAWRSAMVLAGLGLVANLPWLLPALVARTSAVGTDGVFALFAPRAESSLGVLASLVTLGGTWKSSIVAGERTSVVIVGLACVLTLAALLGARHRWRRGGPQAEEVRRLALLAVLCLVVAAVPALGGTDLLDALGQRVAPLALLRDAQRFLAPAALLLAVGAAAATDWARRGARAAPGRESLSAVAGLLVLAPVLLLPSLAWGAGNLERSSYPEDFTTVATAIAGEPAAVTVVLPWTGSYRSFEWAAGRAVLDPAPRFLPGDVLVDDRLFVDGDQVDSEDPRVGEVAAALDGATPGAVAEALRTLGVRWVVVERGQGQDEDASSLPQGRTVVDGEVLLLLDLASGDPSVVTMEPAMAHPGQVTLVIAGYAVLVVLLGAALRSILLTGK